MLINNNKNIPTSMDTISIVNLIFSHSPKPPCTFNIVLSEDALLSNITLFQMLMNILICGAKKLYGEFITADQISVKQFDELKLYMMSMGYIIKYNYTYENEIAVKINIWFEPYMHQTICGGKMPLKTKL